MSLFYRAKARLGSEEQQALLRNVLTWVACLVLAISGSAAQAQGDEGLRAERGEREAISRYRVGSMLGVATMVSEDQVGRMGYDRFDALADLAFSYRIWPWFDAGPGIAAGVFPTANKAGGLLAALLIVRASPAWQRSRPYVHVDFGPAFTGALARAFFRGGLGVEFRISRSFWLGPTFGYAQLFQKSEPGASSDARFLWLGASITFCPARSVPARVPVRYALVEHTTVIRESPPAAPEPAPEPELSPELLELIERATPGGRTELLAPVLFKFDSDALEAIGVAMLYEVARELERRKELELIEIQGYADRRGSAEYNRELSERRARRVLQWLVEHGIAAERLTVAAKGATDFVENGSSESAHEQNRRVIFRVLRTAQK